MPRIDLDPELLDAVVAILDRHVPDRDVRVIGSRVSGRAKRFSDLDIVIGGAPPLDLAALARMREDFEESDLPFSVDLIEWTTTCEVLTPRKMTS